MPPVVNIQSQMEKEMEIAGAKKIYKFVGVVKPPYIEWNETSS